MLKRILTSAVGVILFFAVVFAPPLALYIALFMVCAGMLYETYRVTEAEKPLWIVGFLAEIIMFSGVFTEKIGLSFYGAVFLFMASVVFLWGKSDSKKVMITGMATIFITLSILTLVFLRKKYGIGALFLPFVIAWLSDTGAYFTGRFLGKHKLAPKMSPKKTIEGGVGGVVFAMAATVIWYVIVYKTTDIGLILKLSAIGGIGSVLSQIGDLSASCIKRDFGKKDYGTILPGHGGLMDRFDSVLFAAPYVFLAFTCFGI